MYSIQYLECFGCWLTKVKLNPGMITLAQTTIFHDNNNNKVFGDNVLLVLHYIVALNNSVPLIRAVSWRLL